MKGKITDAGFFKRKTADTANAGKQPHDKRRGKKAPDKTSDSRQDSPDMSSVFEDNIKTVMNEVTAILLKAGLQSSADDIKKIVGEVAKNRFTISVVGEFSKGKSTFINNVFGRDILPVGNMSTTAMLTRIRYNSKEMICITDEYGNKTATLPLANDSWNKYIADVSGKAQDPKGVAFVGLKSDWLKSGIEIIDTPGAGDLEPKRAELIGDALRGSDGAIITVSAQAAMSLTEKLFIEERLISKKTPFLMLIITKLDIIPKEERGGVIDYVNKKLASWKMDIPVFVPYDVELDESKYENIIGMDKIRETINGWVSSPDRIKLSREWLISKIEAVIKSAVEQLNEKIVLIEADDGKREELISQKKALLAEAREVWNSLYEEMQERCGRNCEQMRLSAETMTQTAIERLQYELSHSANPQKWRKEDYPYRLKVELTNMSVKLENQISRKFSEDIRWFNTLLEKNFADHILSTSPSEMLKDSFGESMPNMDVKLKNIEKGRMFARAGMAVLSIASYMVFGAFGIAPVIGSMGISTGGSIATELLFKKKIEEQRSILNGVISNEINDMVGKALGSGDNRIKKMYADVIREGSAQEEKWIKRQEDIIRSSVTDAVDKDKENINQVIEGLNKQYMKLKSLGDESYE